MLLRKINQKEASGSTRGVGQGTQAILNKVVRGDHTEVTFK